MRCSRNAATGAASVSGTMIFGVGAQSNNAQGSVAVYAIDSVNGNFTTSYNVLPYTDSFLDSGSNGLFFNDSSIAICTGNIG